MKLPQELNARQQAFVQEYCVDKNATQAAIRAGYSAEYASTNAFKLLQITAIRAAIDSHLAELSKATDTDSAWVRRRLKEEADDRSENATHAGRIRAIELIGKLNGDFEKDNRQKAVDMPVFRVCFEKPEGVCNE